MATTDENGVVFYEEGDLFSPVHTALNLQSSALTAIFDDVNEQLESVAPTYRYMNRASTGVWGSGTWSTITGLSSDAQRGWPGYSGGDWTVPVDGRYEIYACLAFNGNPDGQRVLRLLKNGAEVAQGAQIRSASSIYPTTAEISVKAVFAAGDVLQLQGLQSAGQGLTVYVGGANSNRFTMERIGSA